MTSIQKSVPALRFKDSQGEDYPSWNCDALGVLFKISAGGDIEITHSRKAKDDVFCYPVYANSEKRNGLHSYSDQFRIDQDCITVSGRGTLGVAHARFEKFFPIVRLLVLVPNKECDLTFCEHAINMLRIFNESTGVPQLTAPQLKKYCLNYPIPEEQQKIADFLSSVDAKIEQLTKKKALLEQYKKGMMQKLFSQETRFKNIRGGDYLDWEKVKFKYLYSFKSTNSFARNKLNYVNGKVRNLHYGDIHTKYQSVFDLDRENVPFLNLDIDLNSVSEDAYCKEGDLVIADASEDYHGIGKTIELLNLNGESVLAGLHTLLAKRNSDRIHIGYGAYVMACNIVRQQIMRIAQGTKVLGISVGRMNEIELPIPSNKEQQKIADFLSAIDEKIELVTEQIKQAQAFKKGLLQQMFI